MKLLIALCALLMSTTILAKYYDRNQLPQLNQEILEQSEFEFTATEVPVSSLIPVQTQRVRDLKKQEKRLIKVEKNAYRPLVIDQQYYIIDGHHRYDALSELGFESARVLLVDAPIEEVVDEFQQYGDNTPTIEEAITIKVEFNEYE